MPKKAPRRKGWARGKAACGWPRRSKPEARDFRNVCRFGSLAPIDKNAEPRHFPCALGAIRRRLEDRPTSAS
jgi:hypothetical protein